MQVLQKRHIKPGHEYDKLFPKSARQDTVIKGAGKAKLHHTINLIKDLVSETLGDTKLLAQILKGDSLETTCRNIWEFVYNHINYCRDKTGVEQVRRPSRTWANRKQGVDCDCYTVFISSILTNLEISHSIRITKYNGKGYFQHIYPVVHNNGKSSEQALSPAYIKSDEWPIGPWYITIDCVTDHFNYEVPFSDYRDFDMQHCEAVSEIDGLPPTVVSGVDSADLMDGLGIFSLKQPELPLREIIKSRSASKGKSGPSPGRLTIKPLSKETEPLDPPKLFVTQITEKAAVRSKKNQPEHSEISHEKGGKNRQGGSGTWIKILLAAGVGYGTYKLFASGN